MSECRTSFTHPSAASTDFDFDGERIRVTPLQVSTRTFSTLRLNMALVHTGIGRRATDTAADQVGKIKDKSIDSDLCDLLQLVSECVAMLEADNNNFLSELGRMLSEFWLIKRRLTKSITNDFVDRIYDAIIASGAYGAKLCGQAAAGSSSRSLRPNEAKSWGRWSRHWR